MAANGGYMPVSPEALARAGLAQLAASSAVGTPILGAKDVLLPRELTNLWLLSDILVIPRPLPFTSVFSIGDCCLALGALVFFQKKLARPQTFKSGALAAKLD